MSLKEEIQKRIQEARDKKLHEKVEQVWRSGNCNPFYHYYLSIKRYYSHMDYDPCIFTDSYSVEWPAGPSNKEVLNVTITSYSTEKGYDTACYIPNQEWENELEKLYQKALVEKELVETKRQRDYEEKIKQEEKKLRDKWGL